MNGDDPVLAFVPISMRDCMMDLRQSCGENLEQVTSIDQLMRATAEKSFAVLLIPAAGFTSEEWWSIWGCIHDMEPRPSILVYALHSDVGMWTSVLDSGGHDLILGPFTPDKLRRAIQEAASEFNRKRTQADNW